MVKINPGSNVRGDNDTSTHVSKMGKENIPEPKMANNMYQCPLCNALFSSRQDYLSHAMSRHTVEKRLQKPMEEGIP